MNSKNNYHLFRIMLLPLLLFVFSVKACAGLKDSVVLEMHDTKLKVPKKYLNETNYFWIKQAKGLDSDEGSFRIKIPIDEIQQVVKGLPNYSNERLTEIKIIVTIITPRVRRNGYGVNQNMIDEIRYREGRYEGAYAEYDNENNWYRIYSKTFVGKGWDVFLKSPFSNKQDIEFADVIARCNESSLDKEMYCFIRHPIDSKKFYIEFDLDYKQLKYYKQVQNFIVKLLESWQ